MLQRFYTFFSFEFGISGLAPQCHLNGDAKTPPVCNSKGLFLTMMEQMLWGDNQRSIGPG